MSEQVALCIVHSVAQKDWETIVIFRKRRGPGVFHRHCHKYILHMLQPESWWGTFCESSCLIILIFNVI